MAIVYQATNLINGKRYIGVTVRSLERRRTMHRHDAKKGTGRVFAKAIRKYGESSFAWKVLHDYLFAEDAMAAEARFVAALRPEYNMTDGGIGVPGLRMPESAKAKMRASHTPERRKKSAARMKQTWAENPDMALRAGVTRTGKPLLKARGKKRSKETVEKLRAAAMSRKDVWMALRHQGPEASARSVLCVDDGKRFSSASAAAKAYGVAKSALIELCLGQRGRKTVGGHVFRYAETKYWFCHTT